MAMWRYSGLVLLLMGTLNRKMVRQKYLRCIANTNIEEYSGRLYAFWQGGLPIESSITSDPEAIGVRRA